MRDSKFWRIMAVSFIVALLYVGHGLHTGRSDSLPSLANTAYAGGVAVSMHQRETLYTSSDDGRTIFQWATSDRGKPKYVAFSTVDLNH